MLEHHSGIVFDKEDKDFDSADYKSALAAENWDAPAVVTTAVQFFESFYANRSSKCRKLHNVTNSVIIFDEAQMMPSENLLPCVAAISTLCEHFNSTAVLCTATQPVVDDYIVKYATNIAIKRYARKLGGHMSSSNGSHLNRQVSWMMWRWRRGLAGMSRRYA